MKLAMLAVLMLPLLHQMLKARMKPLTSLNKIDLGKLKHQKLILLANTLYTTKITKSTLTNEENQAPRTRNEYFAGGAG